jgi:uncharacterized protein (UPF0276 family)
VSARASEVTFSVDAYPRLGVGISYNDAIWAGQAIAGWQAQGSLEGFDYLEAQPPHFALRPVLHEIADGLPMLLHCSQFSLGTPQDAPDPEILALTQRIAHEIDTPWVAEHISWTKFRGGDTHHFFLPFLDEHLLQTIITNAKALQRAVARPLLLENAPRTVILELGEIRETHFISRAVEESGSGFLLDIPSAVTTADRAGYTLEDYLLEMPLHRLIEIHVGDVEAEWDLLELVVQRSPTRAVTLEANLAEVSISDLRGRAVEIRQLLVSTQRAATRREKPASP